MISKLQYSYMPSKTAVFSEYFCANREKDLLYFLLVQQPVISPSIHAIYILRKKTCRNDSFYDKKKALAVSSLYIAT
jgi:hypothetical protein